MPGLDRRTLSTDIQELEDLEYVERMKRGFEPNPPPSPSRRPACGGR
jgi:hypothetical protein